MSIQQLLGGGGEPFDCCAASREREAWMIRVAKELEDGIALLMAHESELT